MVAHKKSLAARTRGPDNANPINRPDAGTPGWGKPLPARVTSAMLRGEEREDILHRVRELGRYACTEFEAAEELGISVMTFRRWLATDAALEQAFELGADLANKRVEKALYHKAMGYSYREEFVVTDNDGVPHIRTKVVHVPPDNTAMIFWLKNRDYNNWRDVKQIEQQMNVNVSDEKTSDPRTLALALLAIMQDAVREQQTTIDHQEAAE